jgi:DNA repair exonuclease SbcCD ATPase subunit
MSNTEQSKNESNKLVVLLIIFLTLSVIGNFYQYFNNKQTVVKIIETERQRTDSVVVLKMELEEEINLVTEELEKYKGISAEMDALLEEAYQKIEDQKKQIAKLIDTKQDYEVLKMRYADLQNLKNEYLEQIERLVEENKKLKYENTELSVAVRQLKDEKTDLTQKVEVAATLKIQELKIGFYKIKTNGKSVEVDKAKKGDRLQMDIVIPENKLAPIGERDVYVRIINPAGYVVADVSEAIKKFKTKSGNELNYTKSYKINYEGKKLETSFVWDNEVFNEGTYKIEIHIDGELAGNGSILLK